MPEKTVAANGIEIWTEDFGDPGDTPILLIMGATASGIYWDESFCQGLADGGRHVIRYDNRDTGQSTCFDFAKDPYALTDMAADAAGVLDAYGLDSAHAVGASMGGMIGQTLAIERPTRIRTLTSIMSSPLGGAVAVALAGGETDLPGPDPEFLLKMAPLSEKAPESREERIAQRMLGFAVLAGSLVPHDEARQRAIATREVDRARDFDAMQNHGLAIANSTADRRPQLRKLDLPTLVIHGTEDPILPYAHGVATADAIPNAELITIERLGHELPEITHDRVIPAILKLTS